MKDLEIINYRPEYKDFVKTLNVEWLEKYFAVEAIDHIQLSDPENEIIKKGGYIYFALKNGIVVGTVSLLRIDNENYELGKMAVTEIYQGHGIGKKLIEHCIKSAKKLSIKKLILYSNTKLNAAIALYFKYGFKEIDINSSHYIRSNVKMELEIK